jgi:hypothetical protein
MEDGHDPAGPFPDKVIAEGLRLSLGKSIGGDDDAQRA